MPSRKRERDLIVVPVHEEVFASARKLRLVAIPITQSAADVRYIAFYRNAPTSAITHFAPVIRIDKNVRYKEIFPSSSEMVKKADMPLKVYHLGPMEVLEHPVKKGWSAPIAGPRYSSIEELRKGHYIDEVWPPETDEAKERLQRRQQEHDERKRREQQQGTAREGPAALAGEDAPKKKRRRGHRGGRGRKKKTAAQGPERAPEAVKAVRAAERPAAQRGGSPSVHYIVDGANVAMEARKMKEGGRLRQIELLVDRLSSVKGAVVTVIVDAGLRHHIDRKDDLEEMIEHREILQAPAQTQADEFILMTAEYLRAKGEKVRIVSNDVYSDYIKRYKPRFDWVHDVQEQFMFIFGPERDDVLDVMISMS